MRFQDKIFKTLRLSCLGLAALLALLAVPQSPAQIQEAVKAKVPFAFKVDTKTLPAGTYMFRVSQDSQTVSVTPEAARDGEALAMILTYVAARPFSGEEHDSHLVFDKVGNNYTLSEIWEPGFDGVVVAMTKGVHEHHVIRVKHSPAS